MLKYGLKCSIIFTICEDINCLVPMDEKRGGFVLAQTAFYSVFLRKILCNNEFFLPKYRNIPEGRRNGFIKKKKKHRREKVNI